MSTRTTTTIGGPSRRSFLSMLAVAGAATAASPLLAACSSEGSSESADGRRKYRIVQPSKDPLVVWAVSYLAEDKGYYRDEGLDVERVLLLGGPAALAGLLSDAGDALISAPGETLSAAAKNQDLRIVMGHTNNMPSTFVLSKKAADAAGVTASSPLAERQSALGRIGAARFGITAPGSQTDAFTRMALAQAGGDADQAQIVPLQTASNCLAALSNGEIEGYVGVPPAGELAIAQAGAVALLTAQDGEIEGADSLQGMSLIVKGDRLESDRDLFAAAIRADVQAMKDLNDDLEAAGVLLRKSRFSALDDTVWEATWTRMSPSLRSPIVTSDSLGAWLSNGLVDAGKVTEDDLDLDQIVDMDLTTEAADTAGFQLTPA